MKNQTVKIWFTIAAFFLSATVSVADCSSNANQCTPKQLCSAATSTEGGVKVWSKSSYYSKHVSTAKQVGINCGVVEIVATCDNDPELCSVDDLCKQSVQKSGGKTGWKTSSKAAGHISLAKEFGLKCGVTETVAKKKTCSQDVRKCNATELCARSTYYNGTKAWIVTGKHVTEAKRRGLSCGVTEKSCSDDMSYCSQSHVCRAATKIVNGKKVWDWNWSTSGKRNFAGEAKHRGLTCGVKGGSSPTIASNTSSYTNTTTLKNAFRGESVLKRKQIQYALKKLNYYTSSIDALYGPGTERALTGYVNAKGLNGHSPRSIFSSVLSQVSVPSSFAVAIQ